MLDNKIVRSFMLSLISGDLVVIILVPFSIVGRRSLHVPSYGWRYGFSVTRVFCVPRTCAFDHRILRIVFLRRDLSQRVIVEAYLMLSCRSYPRYVRRHRSCDGFAILGNEPRDGHGVPLICSVDFVHDRTILYALFVV